MELRKVLLRQYIPDVNFCFSSTWRQFTIFLSECNIGFILEGYIHSKPKGEHCGQQKPVILVVEDDDDIRELVAFSLEEEGYHVEQAADGLRGQEMAETLRPDLIILDLMLPGRDGLSVCRELNKHAAESMPCPILMLTARGEEMDRIIGFEYGADDYVVKPFNIRELMLRVRAILRRRSMDTGKRVITRHGVSPRSAGAAGFHRRTHPGNSPRWNIAFLRTSSSMRDASAPVRSCCLPCGDISLKDMNARSMCI